MDATKLIEEAGREIAHMKAEALSAANPYNENTIRLTLLIDIAAALRASEERARKAEDERDEIAAGLRSSSNLNFAMRQERDALAAANLAANKRIVELEQERDEERRKVDGWMLCLSRLRYLRDERDAARAELAQPSICPNCTAKLRRLDRIDSTGSAAYELDKARKDAAGQNKRAQKAEREAKALRAELEAERRKGCSNG